MILRTAAFLYGSVTRLRNWLFDSGIFPSYQAPFPVISVGNLTAGGNGKTPLTILIVQELRSRGFSPFILSRGYGGSLAGPHLVSLTDPPSLVGDEPLLMLKKCEVPVVIARSRVAGAQFAAKHALGNVAVLDDAFQHRWLKRDLDILSIHVGSAEAAQSFVEGELLPKGRFRESRERGITRAGAVVLATRKPTNESKEPAPLSEVLNLISNRVPVFRSSLSIEGLFSMRGDGPVSFPRAVAFCAIANPQSFFETLTEVGVVLERTFAFRDHQLIGEKELAEMRSVVPGLPLICTEKDAKRLSEMGSSREGQDIFVLKTSLELKPREEFVNLLLSHCGSSPRR